MQQLNPQQPYPARPYPSSLPPANLPPSSLPPANMPPGSLPMGNPMMMNPPYNFPNMRSPFPVSPSDHEEKKNEFKRGIFVSGFQKCVTTAMIQKHFSIKPINGLKHPTTKFKESKGFAFIYYGSEDDALYVKKTLDRTAILRDKIRITRTVISENLSKMMFKLKTHGLSEKQIQENQTKYFNDENLQKEVQRIIKPLFGTTVEVNKISIPKSKSLSKPLRYARVFFYVSDVREARTLAEKSIKSTEEFYYDTTGKNEYEVILNCISHRINHDDVFGAIAKSQIYEYTKKNQSNVLHLKGIKSNPSEDPSALADEIKEYMQKQGLHWNIVNAYADIHEKRGAWANLTFSTYEETVQAYEHLKSLRPKFRDSVLYGSLRNVKDPRTVVISVVRKDTTEKDVQKFLNQLASKSVKAVLPGEEPVRKYDYFSFNIIESKKFFKVDGDETKGVTESESDTIHPSWIEINEVPRRLIIHFFHEFNEEDIKELNNDITVNSNYDSIFIKGDKKRELRSNHQKGHVNKDGVYIKHTEIRGKKKPRLPKTDKPLRPNRSDFPPRNMGPRNNPTRPADFSSSIPSFANRQPPKVPSNLNMQPGQPAFRPQIGATGPSSVPPPTRYQPAGFNPTSSLPPTNMAPLSNLASGFKPQSFVPPNLPPGAPSMNLPQGGPRPPMNAPPPGFPPTIQPPLGNVYPKPNSQPQNNE